MKIITVTALLIIGAAMGSGYEDVSPEEAWFLSMHSNVVTIDVSPIYDQGHLPGSIHAPLSSLEEAAMDWDKSMTYLVYCHGDAPSIQGAETLVEMGFGSVKRLSGNYGAWVEAGYPVEVHGEYMDVSPVLANDLISMNNDLVVVDVSPYWGQGHLPGAVSAPLSTLETAMADWDMEKDYLVYCHGDGPSISGAETLAEAGFNTVYRLEGNYGAWVAAGYVVETD